METKEELRQRFYDDLGIVGGSFPEESFNFFWKEIEAREKRWDEIHEAIGLYPKVIDLVEAADEVIKAADQIKVNTNYTEEIKNFLVAVSKYNQLKSNQ